MIGYDIDSEVARIDADIESLNRAIGAGVCTVNYADRRVEYFGQHEMRQVLKWMQQQRAIAKKGGDRRAGLRAWHTRNDLRQVGILLLLIFLFSTPYLVERITSARVQLERCRELGGEQIRGRCVRVISTMPAEVRK